MKGNVQSGTSDKLNWLKNHTMSDQDRKKLIDEKLNRAMKYSVALASKKK